MANLFTPQFYSFTRAESDRFVLNSRLYNGALGGLLSMLSCLGIELFLESHYIDIPPHTTGCVMWTLRASPLHWGSVSLLLSTGKLFRSNIHSQGRPAGNFYLRNCYFLFDVLLSNHSASLSIIFLSEDCLLFQIGALQSWCDVVLHWRPHLNWKKNKL